MYTLFIDTHSSLITVSLYDGLNVITKEQYSEYSHSIFLAPMIKSIIEENNITFKDIKNIVVVNGPGSFTGLRIGLSEAKTISYLLNIPIYLVSSLKAYLVSDDNLNGVSVLEDNKGFYVCEKKDGEFLEEEYVNDLENYQNKYIVKEVLNVKKVIEYAFLNKPVNPHLVRANYVKKIEAEK